jgi:hypothetical protein
MNLLSYNLKNMEQLNKIKERVMWRVRFIFRMRKTLNSPFFPLAFLAVTAFFLKILVSIENVLANAPKDMDFARQFQFWSSAITSTELTVQAILVVALFLLAVEVRNIMAFSNLFRHSPRHLSVS